ncbi:MAG: hypothetical protein AAF911_01395 [Planctomycetota bacterium]
MEMRDEIIQRLRASPYAPFAVVMSSGDKYPIPDAIMAAVGSSVLHIAHLDAEGFDVLNMRQISSIEVLEAAA